MKWDQEFVAAFFDRQLSASEVGAASKKRIRRGYWLILKCQRLRFCIRVLWELITTFIVYVPATDIIKTVLQGVNARWKKLSRDDHVCIIAALRKLDKKGDVTVTIKRISDV